MNSELHMYASATINFCEHGFKCGFCHCLMRMKIDEAWQQMFGIFYHESIIFVFPPEKIPHFRSD